MPLNKKNIAASNNSPIGVFDSGLGGLTVVKALMKFLPREDIVYFGDSARVPYGTKSKESIIRYSKQNAAILLEYNVKLIVVACNSSSSYAIGVLRKTFGLPIIGVIRPGVESAVKQTKNKRVGIIATPATIRSGSYEKSVKAVDRKVNLIAQPCPLFVPLVEEGWTGRNVTVEIAETYLRGMKKAKVDTLILGCTHYPLLKPTIKRVMGPQVQLIDSAQAVAEAVKNLLEKENLLKERSTGGVYKYLVSDAPAHFRKLAKRFMGFDIASVKRIRF